MADPQRASLGTWPTPHRRLDEVSAALGADVWVKLEEECGAWGGNKVRKLEYILGRARADGVTRLVGFGVGTSNWTSALAYHATAQGFAISLKLSGEIPSHYQDLYARGRVPVRKVPAALFALDALRARAMRDLGGARLLPPGGSGDEGDLGSLHAGREIAGAVAAGSVPVPERVFVATGTAGTAAGIALGMAEGGLNRPLVCVRVTALPYGTVRLVRARIHKLRKRAGLEAVPVPDLMGDDRFFRPGYGHANPASLEAIALAARDGLDLDGTYAAKAFASLIAAARSGADGPLFFVHTSPGPVPAS